MLLYYSSCWASHTGDAPRGPTVVPVVVVVAVVEPMGYQGIDLQTLLAERLHLELDLVGDFVA